MPYQWSVSNGPAPTRLEIWPHQSLPPQGLAAFVLATFTLITIPLFGLLGTVLLWALLPFLLLAVGGIWFALTKSQRDRSTLETLTVTPQTTQLERQDPKATHKNWQCNTYWVRVSQYATSGPVPDYITLKGNGREVEIGSFLSHEERQQLFHELSDFFEKMRADV